MELEEIGKYFLNCFMLIIPLLLWNIIFVKRLPKAYSKDFFWKDIPAIILTSENLLRIIIFILPLFMVLSLETDVQLIGFWMYLLGVTIYFG